MSDKTITRKPGPIPSVNRWEVIRYAIDSNARTARLCVIILVAGVVLAALIVVRLRFWA